MPTSISILPMSSAPPSPSSRAGRRGSIDASIIVAGRVGGGAGARAAAAWRSRARQTDVGLLLDRQRVGLGGGTDRRLRSFRCRLLLLAKLRLPELLEVVPAQ